MSTQEPTSFWLVALSHLMAETHTDPIMAFWNWNTHGYGSGSLMSALMLCLNLVGWVTSNAKQWPTPTSFIWHVWHVQTDPFGTTGYSVYVQIAITFYLACLPCANRWFLNLLVNRLYVRCAITFYLACLTCVNQWFLNHWYIGYMFGVKSHFIWHVWDVQTNYFWPRAVSYTPPHILIKSW